VAPLAVFLAGVAWLGFSGAPDERGFWPVLLAALLVGLTLARSKHRYAEAAVRGMSQPIVMVMVMAWLLAGVLGSLMNATGFVQALVLLSQRLGLHGAGFVVAAFTVCCVVSTATGTSLGTILICGPLLYPAGGVLHSDPAVLIGAIIGGATFGDNISPVSDTTIASATTQEADIGGVVKSRLAYALPAALLALVGYLAFGGVGAQPGAGVNQGPAVDASLVALTMTLAPALVIGLLMARRHLLEGLLYGILFACVIGLGTGLLTPGQLLYIDTENFIARGLVLDGMERGIGVSIFTILLMGVVGGVEASGALDLVIRFMARAVATRRGAEFSVFAAVSMAVILTTHSVVAILTVGKLARDTGRRFGLGSYRVANILDITVCIYPFLLPFFIPTILAASTTSAGEAFGMPRVSAFSVGMYNFHSWALLVVLLVALITGYGRRHRVAPSNAS
jgi:Na+/H+ antiporter NhaC